MPLLQTEHETPYSGDATTDADTVSIHSFTNFHIPRVSLQYSNRDSAV